MQITITNGTLTRVTETLTASSGYSLPSTISVTGATETTYTQAGGVVTLTNLTAGTPATIAATGVQNTLANVTYNGNTIASFVQNGTKTLSCHNTIMASDVVVAATNISGKRLTAAYGGETLFTMTANGTKTLSCSNKYVTTDIVLTLGVNFYNVSYSLTDCETDTGSAVTIDDGGTAQVLLKCPAAYNFVAAAGYFAVTNATPNNVVIDNTGSTYHTCTFTLSNASGDVTVTVSTQEAQPRLNAPVIELEV